VAYAYIRANHPAQPLASEAECGQRLSTKTR
jgi:hypothetical protein